MAGAGHGYIGTGDDATVGGTLTTVPETAPQNLPSQPAPLIGREQELTAARDQPRSGHTTNDSREQRGGGGLTPIIDVAP